MYFLTQRAKIIGGTKMKNKDSGFVKIRSKIRREITMTDLKSDHLNLNKTKMITNWIIIMKREARKYMI